MPRLLGRCRAVVHTTGNLSAASSADLARHLNALLRDSIGARPPFESQRPVRRVVKLPRGRRVLFSERVQNAANTNSAIAAVYQVPQKSTCLSNKPPCTTGCLQRGAQRATAQAGVLAATTARVLEHKSM